MKPFKLFFAIGPGDVCSAYKNWKIGLRYKSETAITFSSQCMEFCKYENIDSLFISYSSVRNIFADDGFLLKNKPKLTLPEFRGSYFLMSFMYSVSLAYDAYKFGAKIAVIDSGSTEWFMLLPFNILGIKVIPNFHNTYQPEGHPAQGLLRRFIRVIDRIYFRLFTKCAMGVSPACGRQYIELAGSSKAYFDYKAQFAPEDFVKHPNPSYDLTVFKLLYVGRLEENKGILDMLEILRILDLRKPGGFTLEICGDGSMQSKVELELSNLGVSHLVRLNGRLDRALLLEAYQRCHVVVVPTKSTFTEGMSLACVEAVLMNRPVVTNRVVPALEVLGDGAIEAETDNVESYASIIFELSMNKQRYRSLAEGCSACASAFLDTSLGIRSALVASLARYKI